MFQRRPASGLSLECVWRTGTLVNLGGRNRTKSTGSSGSFGPGIFSFAGWSVRGLRVRASGRNKSVEARCEERRGSATDRRKRGESPAIFARRPLGHLRTGYRQCEKDSVEDSV